ncbi:MULTISPECIES: hypothetical protein [Cohnella]|uniref:hypothetical protein n=1 Tax=Cohnella TaxID=329857 RepID=UPI000E37FBA3|nr:hypothetical protein [Cohnella sp.]REK66043.1 MAG: polyketide cyclase [Cohnella sp.]
MKPVLRSKTLMIYADCPFGEAYDYISDPNHLPRWAPGFYRSVRKAEEGWIAETPEGPKRVRFADPNEFGVLDHWVSPISEAGAAAGEKTLRPMRVLPKGAGCEVMFTVFQQAGKTYEQFVEDTKAAEQDLRRLKVELERVGEALQPE